MVRSWRVCGRKRGEEGARGSERPAGRGRRRHDVCLCVCTRRGATHLQRARADEAGDGACATTRERRRMSCACGARVRCVWRSVNSGGAARRCQRGRRAWHGVGDEEGKELRNARAVSGVHARQKRSLAAERGARMGSCRCSARASAHAGCWCAPRWAPLSFAAQRSAQRNRAHAIAVYPPVPTEPQMLFGAACAQSRAWKQPRANTPAHVSRLDLLRPVQLRGRERDRARRPRVVRPALPRAAEMHAHTPRHVPTPARIHPHAPHSLTPSRGNK
jgi:hypothetical protein